MPIGNADFQNIKIRPLHIKGARTLKFHSIITEFSDSWNPKWSPTEVHGRMDPISFFSSVSRELTLGFRVISDDVKEAKENMQKAQKLIQYQYPRYYEHPFGAKVLYAPPYFEFQFLNVLRSRSGASKLYGYINSAVQINPGFQTKDQAQFFDYPVPAAESAPPEKIYFSDFTITLRIQVLHTGKSIGWTNSSFSDSLYPYGVKNENAPAEPADPQNPKNQVAATGAAEKGKTPGATAKEEAEDVAPKTPPTSKAKRDQTSTKNMKARAGDDPVEDINKYLLKGPLSAPSNLGYQGRN